MKIRLANKNDEYIVSEFCKKHNMSLPTSGAVLLSMDKEGNLLAMIAIDQAPRISCFIAENSLAGHELFYSTIGILVNEREQRVECFIKDDQLSKLQPLYEKLGFQFVEKTNRFYREL